MEMAPGDPCEGMASDQDQPALCYQHCTIVPQSFDILKLPTVSLPAVVQVHPSNRRGGTGSTCLRHDRRGAAPSRIPFPLDSSSMSLSNSVG